MRFNAPVAGDLELIRQHVPSAFSETARPTVSSSYAHINTAKVIEKMFAAGFTIARAQQKKTRTEERRQFTRHLIAFRQPGVLRVDDFVPEFVLINAHDGTTAYNLYFGIFRVICANGMVVGSKWGGISIAHRGDVAEAVLRETFKLIEGQMALFEKIDVMKARGLAEEEQRDFAKKAMEIRYKDNQPFPFLELLKPRRGEDDSNSLWLTLNRIQENLMKGGQEGKSTTGRRVTTRPIERVTKDVIYNRRLWDVAESYLA